MALSALPIEPTIMETLIVLTFLNNLVMSGIKWAFSKGLRVTPNSSLKLRGILAILSLVGVVSAAALKGNAVDPNTVSDLVMTFLDVVLLTVTSHVAYKAIKLA